MWRCLETKESRGQRAPRDLTVRTNSSIPIMPVRKTQLRQGGRSFTEIALFQEVAAIRCCFQDQHRHPYPHPRDHPISSLCCLSTRIFLIRGQRLKCSCELMERTLRRLTDDVIFMNCTSIISLCLSGCLLFLFHNAYSFALTPTVLLSFYGGLIENKIKMSFSVSVRR